MNSAVDRILGGHENRDLNQDGVRLPLLGSL